MNKITELAPIFEIQSSLFNLTAEFETKKKTNVNSYDEELGLHRRLRYGQRINYSLGKSDRADLEFLLREISPFKSFKKGQFDALCSMLNANGHAVCIMPTGSGKSLIYYFAALLQPQVVFVVAPTDILIRDQIRNLKKFHHFDIVRCCLPDHAETLRPA